MTVSDDEEPRARAALARLADPAMLDQVARRTGRRLAGPPRLDVRLRAPELHVDPATWRTGFVSVEREVDIPQELKRDLQELTPQAILRDLHRPVRQSIWHEREPVATDVDPGGRRAYAEARAALVREAREFAGSYAVPAFTRDEKNLVKLRAYFGAKLKAS